MSETPPETPAEPSKPFKKRWRPSDFEMKGSQDGSVEENVNPIRKMGEVLNQSPKMRVVKPNIPDEAKKEEGEKAEEKEEEEGDENTGGVKGKIKKFDGMQ